MSKLRKKKLKYSILVFNQEKNILINIPKLF